MTPSTPPRSARRAHTPPSPTHGPLNDNYEPYSPRRSNRSSNNPFSSSNITQPTPSHIPPVQPAGKKRAAFGLGFAPSDLLTSPPTSPERPRQADNQKSLLLTKTPRRIEKQNAANLHDNFEPSSSARKSFLPTPSKTPSKTPTTTPSRKHNRTASMQESARILHFRPEDANDVMPGRRTKRGRLNAANANGFDLDEDDFAIDSSRNNPSFEIYAESHARVPEMDVSDDNPFVRPRANTVPQRRRSPRQVRKSAEQVEEERLMDEAVARKEGAVFMFRGKKVFRKFEDEGVSSDSDHDPSASHRQRALRHAAGATAERTITRSNMQPRLLFPTATSHLNANDVDEEAETDIEISVPAASASSKPSATATPAKSRGGATPMMSPPSRARASRTTDASMFTSTEEEEIDLPTNAALPTPAQSSKKKKVAIDPVPVFEEMTPEPEAATSEVNNSVPPPTPGRSTRKKPSLSHLPPLESDDQGSASLTSSSAGKRKISSPFDSWPRMKPGSKRTGDKLESSSTKRTRSAATGEAN